MRGIFYSRYVESAVPFHIGIQFLFILMIQLLVCAVVQSIKMIKKKV